MHKSELRHLALRYADGSLDPGQYLRERSGLIDDIAAGRRPIVRVPDPPPARPAADRPSPPASAASPEPVRGYGVLVAAALVLAALVGAGAFYLFAGERPAPVVATASPRALPAPAPGEPALALAERFAAAPDWSESGLIEFEERWEQLPEAMRAAARASPRFRPFVTALAEAIAVQQAVAALGKDAGGTGASGWGPVERGRRLAAFGDALGVGHALPRFAARAEVEPDAPGADWFARQPGTHFTLQLFSTPSEGSAIALAEGYPGLGLRVQRSPDNPPYYRVVYGSFENAAGAAEAAEALPGALVERTGIPLVRSLSKLQGVDVTP